MSVIDFKSYLKEEDTMSGESSPDGYTEEEAARNSCPECGYHSRGGKLCTRCCSEERDEMVDELRDLAPEASQHRALLLARWGRAAVERSFEAACSIVESEREEEEG
jgi:hypothetical protein